MSKRKKSLDELDNAVPRTLDAESNRCPHGYKIDEPCPVCDVCEHGFPASEPCEACDAAAFHSEPITDAVSDDPAKVKELITKTYPPLPNSTVQGFGGHASHEWWNRQSFCRHTPQKVIRGQGWGVWAGTKSDCANRVTEFDVIINCTATSILPEHRIPFDWGRQYERVSKKEILLDWPDGDVPVLPAQFWIDLTDHLKNTKGKALVFCLGGHGRTGTATACMLLACGWTARQAIPWIRKNYCFKAIETAVQETYIEAMDKAMSKLTAQANKKGETK